MPLLPLLCAALLGQTSYTFPDGGIDISQLPPEAQERMRQYQEYAQQRSDAGVTSPLGTAAVVAKAFLGALASGSPDPFLELITQPMFIEGRYYETAQQAQLVWQQLLEKRQGFGYSFGGMELLTVPEMEARYGKPPARLSAWPLKAPGTLIAVGNFSGHAVLLLLKKTSAAYVVAGFSD